MDRIGLGQVSDSWVKTNGAARNLKSLEDETKISKIGRREDIRSDIKRVT